MTETEAETFQHWRGMNGATAYHLIERHADGWPDISMMMAAWLKANTEAAVFAEREACAKVCEDFDFSKRCEIEPPKTLPRYLAAAIRMSSNKD